MKRKLLSILALLCLTVSGAWAMVLQPGDAWDEGSKTLTVYSNPGDYAYHDNSDILHLVITAEVTEIGNSAFHNCENLATVTFEEESELSSIGEAAFDFTSLTSVTIPASVTSIGMSPFLGCSYLETITVESDNTVYDSRDDCNAIIETETNTLIQGCNGTTIPATVTSIAVNAFSSLSLTSVTIPEGVTSIAECAFNYCTGLEAVSIPASVESIGACAFMECKNLATVTFADGSLLTSIGEEAFDGTPLTSVTIPERVTSIGELAFNNTGLTSVNIPASVTSIGERPFGGCSDLATITVDGGNTVYNSLGGCNAIIETATNTLIQGCNGSTIPDDVTSIADYAFYGSSLTSVTIPASVTGIGNHAFENCSSLNSVTFAGGSQLSSIGWTAFAYTSLTSVTIPASVTSIDVNVFYGCENLTSVTIYSPSCTLMYNSFNGCSNLSDIYVVSDKVDWYTANLSNSPGVIKAIPNLTANSDGAGNYWATYYNNLANAKVPEGTQVFKVRLEGTELEMTEISDRVINMGVGVVLKSNSPSIELLYFSSESNEEDNSNNSLKGTMSSITNPDYGHIYVLGGKNGVGFYKLSETGTIGANKAYLTYDGSDPTLAREFFLFGDATGIETIDHSPLTIDHSVYDLQGRRVAQPAKGLYIVNGKKVIK